jgi:hypothetical protein
MKASPYFNWTKLASEDQALGDRWIADRYWLWDGATFRRLPDSSPVVDG